MSDQSGGPGWWQASDDKWYPPDATPGFWLASNGDWYAPELKVGAPPPPATPDQPPGPGFWRASTGEWLPPHLKPDAQVVSAAVSEGHPPGYWQASDGNWYPPDQQPGILPPPPSAGFAPAGPSAPYYGYQPATVAPRTNGFAIASLVLGLVWLWFIGSILALIFGYKAKREIDASNGQQTGRGMAVAGIVLGWIGTVGTVLLIVAIMMLGQSAQSNFEKVGTGIGGTGGVNTDPVDGYCNSGRYLQDPDC